MGPTVTDREDLVDRLDSVSETLDTRELAPLFVFPNGDGEHVDSDGDPVPADDTGAAPGVFVLPNSVTDEWVDHE